MGSSELNEVVLDQMLIQCVWGFVPSSEAPARCPWAEKCWHARPHTSKSCKDGKVPCHHFRTLVAGTCSIVSDIPGSEGMPYYE